MPILNTEVPPLRPKDILVPGTETFQPLPGPDKNVSPLKIKEKLRNFNRARDEAELGNWRRAFLAADHHARLRTQPIQEAQIRHQTEELVAGTGNLTDQFKLFSEYHEYVIDAAFSDKTVDQNGRLINKGSAATGKLSAIGRMVLPLSIPGYIARNAVLSGTEAGTALATAGEVAGKTALEVAKPLTGWLSVIQGIRGAGEILKGRGTWFMNKAALLGGETKQIIEFTKGLYNAKDSLPNSDITRILKQAQLPNATPAELIRAMHTLTKFKRLTMENAWINNSVTFKATIPDIENNQTVWKQKQFNLKDVFNGISAYQKKLFDVAGTDATKRDLLKVALGVEGLVNPNTAQSRILGLGNEILKKAVDIRFKYALGTALATPALAISFVNLWLPGILHIATGGGTAAPVINKGAGSVGPMFPKDYNPPVHKTFIPSVFGSTPSPETTAIIPQSIPTPNPEIITAVATPTPGAEYLATMTPIPPRSYSYTNSYRNSDSNPHPRSY